MEGLFDVVRQRFVDGADGLRASAAVAALDRIGWGAVSPAERMAVATLRAGLSRVRAEPAMRRAELAATLSSVVAAGAAVPAELEGDVLVLLDDTGKGDVATPARIARLKRAEASFSRSTVRLARLAREMCEAELYRSRRS